MAVGSSNLIEALSQVGKDDLADSMEKKLTDKSTSVTQNGHVEQYFCNHNSLP